MKRTTTIVTCDVCGHVSYGDTVSAPEEIRKWALIDRSLYPNPVTCPSYLDICPSCYSGLVKYISSRRPKSVNKNQMTFEKDFPEFVTEEKDEKYFEALEKDDPKPWKNK